MSWIRNTGSLHFSCVYSVTHPSCSLPRLCMCVREGCPWVLLVCFWWVNTPCNYHPGPTLITAREKVSESTHQHLLRIHITQVRLASSERGQIKEYNRRKVSSVKGLIKEYYTRKVISGWGIITDIIHNKGYRRKGPNKRVRHKKR